MKEIIIEQTQFNLCKAIYPEYMAAFSKSILSIEQDNVDLVYAKVIFPNDIWTETRYPQLDTSINKSTILFDLQAAIRAYFNQIDKFGDLTDQNSYKLLNDRIYITLEVQTDLGNEPVTTQIQVIVSYSSYILQNGIVKQDEYLYRYVKDNVNLQQLISFTMPSFADAPITIYDKQNNNIYSDIRSNINIVNLDNFFNYPYIRIFLKWVFDFDNDLNRVDIDKNIHVEELKTCGSIFRYINNHGVIRYVSLMNISEVTSTKSKQSYMFDKYEQPIITNNQLVEHKFHKSQTTRTVNYRADAIEENYMPLFDGFLKSSFVQIYNEDKGFWSNVMINSSSIKKKRKMLLTDISVNIIIETENNIY